MVVTKRIGLQTKGRCDIIDITPQVEQQLAETDINNGGLIRLFIYPVLERKIQSWFLGGCERRL
jgi:thiamine phosphate synthase YjbQ (UPF0047 family)